MIEVKEKITVASHPEALYAVRCFIENAAERAGFSHSDTWKLMLAVDEACSNVIRHAYKCNPDRHFDISVEFKSNRLAVHIDDSGTGYDLRNHCTPNMQDYISNPRPGGLGIKIIKQLVDEIDYEQTNERNKLTLTKHLPLEPAGV